MWRNDEDVVVTFGEVGRFAVFAMGGVGFLAVRRRRGRRSPIHCRDGRYGGISIP